MSNYDITQDFVIVKKRWYHSVLDKFTPKDITPLHRLHISTSLGKKFGKWYVVEPRTVKVPIHDVTNRATIEDAEQNEQNEVYEENLPENFPASDAEQLEQNNPILNRMYEKLEEKYAEIAEKKKESKEQQFEAILQWHNEQRENISGCFGDTEKHDKTSDKCRSCILEFYCLEKNFEALKKFTDSFNITLKD